MSDCIGFLATLYPKGGGYDLDEEENCCCGSIQLDGVLWRGVLAADDRSGQRRLDANAAEAMMKWRFSPGTRGGDPVAAAITMEQEFSLINASRH
jgi:hypothetical protein